MKKLILVCLIGFTCLHSYATDAPPQADSTKPRKQSNGKVQFGVASYYHQKFHGRQTASGELYDVGKMTAAHNSLPINTWVRVTNLRNNKTVLVRINDQLHHKNTRLVDLSHAAAKKLGYIGRGLVKVKLEVLDKSKVEAYVNK